MRKLSSNFAIFSLLLINLFAAKAETEILDYIVAVVNEDVIVNSALQQELRVELERWQQKPGGVPPRENLEKRVLQRMILDLLQLQLATRTGIQIEDSQLNERLRKIAAQNKTDLASFRKRLETQGFSYKHWREQIRQRLITERLQQRHITNRINITDREIENFLATQAQQGTISREYHLLHILIATPEAPSAEEIELKQRKAEETVTKLKQGADFQAMAVAVSDSRQALDGGDLGWLKAGELPSLFEGLVNKMEMGDIEGPLRNSSGFHIIKLVAKRGGQVSVTQTKARHILMKTNELMSDSDIEFRLNEIKSRLELGQDFAKLAQSYSEDPGSANKGGSLDWVNPGDMVPEFEAVMKKLADNEISEPFKSRFGWHIVQVLERREHDNSEQALRYQAARQIHQRKAYEELEAWLRELRDEAYIEYRIENFKDVFETEDAELNY